MAGNKGGPAGGFTTRLIEVRSAECGVRND